MVLSTNNFLLYSLNLLAIILVIAKSEGQLTKIQQNSQIPIDIGTGSTIKIDAQKKVYLSVTINKQVSEKQNLYIAAQSPYNDPFQLPLVYVTSDQQYRNVCYEEANDFMDVCEIQNKQLKLNRKFVVQLFCQVDCQLFVSVYLSQMYKLQLGQSITLSNKQATPIINNFILQIPIDAQFTQFFIISTPKSIDQSIQSSQILVNYGQDPAIATRQNYMEKAQSASAHRLGVFLSKNQLKPGDKITITVLLAPNNQVQLRSSLVNKNVNKLYLGQPIYDFIASSNVKDYTLDLSQYQTQNQTFDSTVRIKFIPYSGAPTVQVSFEPDFSLSKLIQSWDADQSQSFEITNKLRKQNGFNKIIYIRVKGFFSSNYYIGAFVDKKPFIGLQPQITQLIHLQQRSLKNLIFTDSNFESQLEQDGVVQYKISLKLIINKVKFFIRDCGSKDKTKILDCLVKKPSDLQNEQIIKSFNTIYYKQDDSVPEHLVFIIQYNVKDICLLTTDDNNQTIKKYKCRFHIILLNQNDNQAMAGIQIMKDTIRDFLYEGQVKRGSVAKNQLTYYAFYLPDTQNISALQFFVTVMQGDVSLLVSKQIKYPTIRDLSNENDLIFSIYNTLTLTKSQLQAGYYYIGVYGYSMTDFHIGVAIERKRITSNNDSTTTQSTQNSLIRLQKGQSQTHTMSVNKSKAQFIFSPAKKQLIIVKITEVQGEVSYKVHEQGTIDNPLCDSIQMKKNGDQQCQFQAENYIDYIVTVIGAKQQIQIFTILYSSELVCNYYSWNFPLYVNLQSSQKQCMKFIMIQLQDIHISLGLSALQVISKSVSTTIRFPNRNVKIVDHEKTFTRNELQLLCTQKQENSRKTYVCSFELQFENSQNQSASFYCAVQDYRGQNVLIDGVSTKIQTNKISTQVSKNFFYYAFMTQRVQDLYIFLISQTNSKYRVVAKIVTSEQFIRDFNEQLYPKFQQTGKNTFIIDSSDLTPVTLLNINKQVLSSAFEDNTLAIILISVFGIPTTRDSTYIFRMQVSSGGSELILGESKIGYVDVDSIYEYQITLDSQISSSIEIRQFDQKCVKAFILNPLENYQVTQINYMETFNNESGSRTIMIKTDKQSCNYQISYNSMKLPITNMMASIPYNVSLSDSKIKYFTYYHNSRDSFYIIQMVKAGNSYLYVNEIKINDNIEDIFVKGIQNFTFKSEINADLEISSKNPSFCLNCFYLIAIRASETVNAQITINPSDVPIFLKDGALLRDRVQSQQLNKYQVYSKNSFNISITVLYGKVKISTIKSNSVVLPQQVLTADNSYQLMVNASRPQNNSDFDFFSQKYKYLVSVKGQQASSYYISIKKKQSELTIYQNLPLTIQLQQSKQVTVLFQNIQDLNQIYVLIQDLKFYENQQKTQISFAASIDPSNSEILSQNNVQSTYNIKLKAKKGTYTLKISSKITTTILLMIAKNQFTNLHVGRKQMMDKPSYFQIFSPGLSVFVQIFACLGEIDVRASSNYSSLTKFDDDPTGVIRMQHGNYGGHYVITAQKLNGEYFIQTKPEQQGQQIRYIITYHLFNSSAGQKMPYHVYTVKNLQISYAYTSQGVTFTMFRMQRKDGAQMDNGNVTYKFYISKQSKDIQKVTKCSTGQVFVSVQSKEAEKHGIVTFKFTTEKIKQIVGDSQTYVVGAQSILRLSQFQNFRANEIKFVYEMAQLSLSNQINFGQQRNNSPKDSNFTTILIWIVLPFLLGSVLLFFAARYLLRSFSAYPSQLVEQDQIGRSEEGFKNNNQNIA